MVWGLLPHFAADEQYKYKTINAKAETVDTLPTFRHSFVRKRCLVPATGFYEPDKINFVKQPFPWHYFKMKDNSIFSFAGLYDVWKDKYNGKEIHSYSIITTVPNTIVGRYHDRMPVILEKEDEEKWLNPGIDEASQLHSLLKPFPDHELEEWEVVLKREIRETTIQKLLSKSKILGKELFFKYNDMLERKQSISLLLGLIFSKKTIYA